MMFYCDFHEKMVPLFATQELWMNMNKDKKLTEVENFYKVSTGF